MPKIGKKKKLLHSLDQLFLFKLSQSILEPQSVEGIQALTNEYIMQTELVKLTRYASNRIQIRKNKKWTESFLPSSSGGRFRQQYRVNRATFQHLVSLLAATPLFLTTSRASLRLQLAVGLFRFGRSGNGCSIRDISSRFSISDGCVHSYTRRIIHAINTLRPEYITWPSPAEMARISNRLKTRGFPGCVGSVDGTSVPFFEKPLDQPEDYYSRKQEYAMQLQLIFDDNKRILHMYTGMPASVHDATVFRHSGVNLPEEFYLLGDSAYANSNTVVTPFRRRIGTRPIRERTFNKQLASVRIAAEHGIGILKSRFQSLRELRIRVDTANGHRRVCEWISACCILHNIVCERDPWNQNEDSVPNGEELQQEAPNTETGRRVMLMNYIWELKTTGAL